MVLAGSIRLLKAMCLGWAACHLQAGCGLLPVYSKLAPSASDRLSSKNTGTNNAPPAHRAPQTAANQLSQASPLEEVDSHRAGKTNPNTPILAAVPEPETCPVLEVASRVFPDGEKPLVSGGVILAELTNPTSKTYRATVSANEPSESGSQPAIAPLSQPIFPETEPASARSLASPGSLVAATDSKKPVAPENRPSSAPGEPPQTEGSKKSASPAGEERFLFTKLVLCKRVEGFGQYDPVAPGYKFSPGTKGFPGERVLLYAEMNSPPRYTADGTHRTKLSGEVEILRQADQSLVCKLGFPGREDCSRTARKDHHLVYSFHVPPGLPPGTYTLRVNARDCSQSRESNGKCIDGTSQASASVDFQVDVGRTGAEPFREKSPQSTGGVNTP
jgi:hypothetical protein